MRRNNILYLAILATLCTVLTSFTAVPKKKAFVYDGLVISSTREHILDWEKLAADKHLTYVYFDIPFPACDTAILRQNVIGAQAQGLKTGVCFTFTDSLQTVNGILDHLRSIPVDLSEISPMISVPQERTFERKTIHRWIQVWANVIKKHYGEQPILKANRENCKDYLAPVLTSTYRICLVFPEYGGSYMMQNTTPYITTDNDILAFPCRICPE